MADVNFTVFGGGGFVGRHLANLLRQSGYEVTVFDRNNILSGAYKNRELGHVIYAIGLTADFRSRLQETVDAHVSLLNTLLHECEWQSWLYLSSTRVYGSTRKKPCAETDFVSVTPSADAVYDLSKLLGEALCVSHSKPTCRAVRLSNVFGAGMNASNFLGALEAGSREGANVRISEDRDSAKDYIPIERACDLLMKIALFGKERLYNVASGQSIDHAAIAALLHETRNAIVSFAANGAKRRLPEIDTTRIETEFSLEPTPILNDLRAFLAKQS